MQIASSATAAQCCPGPSFAPRGILSERQAQWIVNVFTLQAGQMIINLMAVPAALRANLVSITQLQLDPITTIQGRKQRCTACHRSCEKKGAGWAGTYLHRVDPAAGRALQTGISVGSGTSEDMQGSLYHRCAPRALALQCQTTLLMCRATLPHGCNVQKWLCVWMQVQNKMLLSQAESSITPMAALLQQFFLCGSFLERLDLQTCFLQCPFSLAETWRSTSNKSRLSAMSW